LDYECAKVNRIFFARLSEGEDLIEAVEKIAEKEKIEFGVFFVIGTLKKAVFGFYSPQMRPVTMEEPLEITSCIGNISRKDEKLKVHAHINITDSKFHCYGGHLLSGCEIDRVGELAILELTKQN